MKYTGKQYVRSLFGRCLRCGITKEEALNTKGTRIFVTCERPWERHQWKMR